MSESGDQWRVLSGSRRKQLLCVNCGFAVCVGDRKASSAVFSLDLLCRTLWKCSTAFT